MKLSIVMPTFNEENRLGFTLSELRKQSLKSGDYDILIVDGGSTDKTRDIAKKYDCKVLDNPKTQQEYGKHIGLLQAKSNYVMFLDADEILENIYALENRINTLNENKDVKFVHTGGYIKPKGFSKINDYINNFSDPFVYFMSGITSHKKYFLKHWKKHYTDFEEKDGSIIFNFQSNTLLPPVDACAGNVLDKSFLKDNLGKEINSVSIVPILFTLITKHGGRVAVLKNDAVIHYSADSIINFIRKIRWRVIVNIHYPNMPGTGFSNRETSQPVLYQLKKIFFIPYALSLLLPLLVASYHSITRKNFSLLLHFPLTVYTAVIILYYYFLKIMCIKPKIKSYGKEKKGQSKQLKL